MWKKKERLKNIYTKIMEREKKVMKLYEEMRKKEAKIVTYAFKLYNKAGGSLETHSITKDVHKVSNNSLLQNCFERARLKYN